MTNSTEESGIKDCQPSRHCSLLLPKNVDIYFIILNFFHTTDFFHILFHQLCPEIPKTKTNKWKAPPGTKQNMEFILHCPTILEQGACSGVWLIYTVTPLEKIALLFPAAISCKQLQLFGICFLFSVCAVILSAFGVGQVLCTLPDCFLPLFQRELCVRLDSRCGAWSADAGLCSNRKDLRFMERPLFKEPKKGIKLRRIFLIHNGNLV